MNGKYHIEPIKNQFMIDTGGYSYVQSTNHICTALGNGELNLMNRIIKTSLFLKHMWPLEENWVI